MRIAIVGDTHGNGPAFDAILEEMGDVDRVFGLGGWLHPSAGSYRIAEWVQETDGPLWDLAAETPPPEL